MKRSCGACGESIDHLKPTARYCDSKCRTRATRQRARGVTEIRVTPQPTVVEPSSLVYAATLAELTEAGRAETTLGAKCLVMAARIDARQDTGSALASLVKQHDASMAEAVKGAIVVRSALDELRARRDAKLA